MSRTTDPMASLAAYASIAGAIVMLVGAALMGASGADLWSALDQDDMAGYLSATAEVQPLLIANLSFWIVGVLILGVAGLTLVRLCTRRPAIALVAQTCFATGVPLAVFSFLAMMSVVVQIAPDTSAASLQLAEVVGWMGAHADDLATVLIIGAGPFFLALAGRGEWMPTWLVRWGYLAGAAGLFSVATQYVAALTDYSLVIVPIGMGWMLAVGVVLLRRGEKAPDPENA